MTTPTKDEEERRLAVAFAQKHRAMRRAFRGIYTAADQRALVQAGTLREQGS